MADLIEERDGIDCFAYAESGGKGWHGKGQALRALEVYDEPPGIVLERSNNNWQAHERPTFYYASDGKTLIQCKKGKAIVRDCDDVELGAVGPRFTVAQNQQTIEFMRPWLESREASIETFGSLQGGSVIFALAKIDLKPLDIVANDTIRRYILLSNMHDRGMSFRIGFTDIRVVCNNTLQAALADKQSTKLIRIRHNRNIIADIEAVRDTMNLMTQQFEASVEQYRALARKSINQADLCSYMKKILSIKPETPRADMSVKLWNTYERLIELAETGTGNNLPGVSGTYWTAYNGVTQWLTHERGHNDNTRMNSLYFGEGASLNKKALDLAISLAV